MSERETDVKTVKVELVCDECGGEMVANGIGLMSSPPQYPHVCAACGYTLNVRGKTYPYIKHVAT